MSRLLDFEVTSWLARRPIQTTFVDIIDVVAICQKPFKITPIYTSFTMFGRVGAYIRFL